MRRSVPALLVSFAIAFVGFEAKAQPPENSAQQLVTKIKALIDTKTPFLLIFSDSSRKEESLAARRHRRMKSVQEYEDLKSGITIIRVDLAISETDKRIYQPFLMDEAEDYRTLISRGGVLAVGWDGKDVGCPQPLGDGYLRITQLDLYVRALPNVRERFVITRPSPGQHQRPAPTAK